MELYLPLFLFMALIVWICRGILRVDAKAQAYTRWEARQERREQRARLTEGATAPSAPSFELYITRA